MFISYCEPSWNQIAFVQHQDNMLMGRVLPQMRFYVVASCSKRVSGVKDFAHDVRRVQDFVELIPDSFRLTSFHNFRSISDLDFG